VKLVHVVGAVIQNEQDEILCAKRASHLSLGGYWEFPGGKIEESESHEQALIREIQEEMGVDIEVGDLVADIYHEYPNAVVHLITYFCTLKSGTLSSTDHDELVWLEAARLHELEWAPADVPTVEKLLTNATEGKGR
jgi:8-oxo-dGTP diphosphatase